MRWYLAVWRNYFGFYGRARRKEFNMFMLIHVIIWIGLECLGRFTYLQPDPVSGDGGQLGIGLIVLVLYLVAVFMPWWAVIVRRLHDLDFSGWWVLISFVPILDLFLLAMLVFGEGAEGENRFGSDPKTYGITGGIEMNR